MAKINKVDLSRGTTLTSTHWNNNKSQVAGVLSGNIDTENLTLNKGKFSITFNWPRLVAEDFAYTSEVASSNLRYEEESQGIYVPILLPPLQDKWTETLGSEQMPKLLSMSVSFDNYMQNWAVKSETATPIPSAGLNPVAASANKYKMNIELREKEQWFFYGNTTTQRSQNIAPKSIFKGVVAGELFNGSEVRFNPYFINGIDKIFNPFKTYLLKIDFPQLFGSTTDARYTPPSLTVKLDFESRMVERDRLVELTSIQNFPLTQQETTPTVSLDTAVAGQKITATGGAAQNGRIQTNLEAIDSILLNGVESGMDIRSNPPINRRIVDDASYFCLAVPMFNSFLDVRSSDLNNIGLPYGPQGTFGGDPIVPGTVYWKKYLFDQRLIPISQPCTIHHVFAVHDYGSHYVDGALTPGRIRNGSGQVPESPTFIESIGVGIASGLRSESKKYEQVAYVDWAGANKFNYLVDQVVDGVIPTFYGAMTVGGSPGYQTDQEIFQVPLMDNVAGGAGTRSYYDQGMPYFIGKSDLNTKSRSNVGVIGAGIPRVPATIGEELYLDVRWYMTDIDATYGMSWVTGDTVRNQNVQYIGSSKCWIYIIGKMNVAT